MGTMNSDGFPLFQRALMGIAKYGNDEFGWFPSISKGPYGYSLWRYISNGGGDSFHTVLLR